jgi:hypothetical protein
VLGIAWTIRRDIADGFARGHRNIRLPKPVVASALIPKEHIFFVTDDREEKEIILNPRRLSKLVVEPFRTSCAKRLNGIAELMVGSDRRARISTNADGPGTVQFGQTGMIVLNV